MFLLFLEFIGTQELLLIMVVALVVFGPRRLPELGRSLGKSLSEFKRASEDFKKTWEMEAETENAEREARDSRLMSATALPEVGNDAPSSAKQNTITNQSAVETNQLLLNDSDTDDDDAQREDSLRKDSSPASLSLPTSAPSDAVPRERSNRFKPRPPTPDA